MERWLYVVLPLLMLVFFSGLLALFVVLVRRTDKRLEHKARRIGQVGAALWLVWLTGVTAMQGQVPVLNLGQTFLFLGALVWLGQCYAQRQVDQRLFTLLPLTGVVVLVLVGLATGLQPGEVPPTLRGVPAALHITLSLTGIAMLLGSGVFGAGQVILHGQIQNRRFDQWFLRLPSLDDLDRLRRVTLVAGWVLVWVSLISAMIWMTLRAENKDPISSHIHPVVTLAALITILVMADRFRWLSRARLALIGALLSAIVLALLLASVVEIFLGGYA